MLEYINVVMIALIALYAMIVHIVVVRLKLNILKLLDEVKTYQRALDNQRYEETVKAFNRIVELINKNG